MDHLIYTHRDFCSCPGGKISNSKCINTWTMFLKFLRKPRGFFCFDVFCGGNIVSQC